jgi:hypothetical protein
VVGYATDLGRARVDVGYRYRRAFHVGDTVDFSQIVVGFGVNF